MELLLTILVRFVLKCNVILHYNVIKKTNIDDLTIIGFIIIVNIDQLTSYWLKNYTCLFMKLMRN